MSNANEANTVEEGVEQDLSHSGSRLKAEPCRGGTSNSSRRRPKRRCPPRGRGNGSGTTPTRGSIFPAVTARGARSEGQSLECKMSSILFHFIALITTYQSFLVGTSHALLSSAKTACMCMILGPLYDAKSAGTGMKRVTCSTFGQSEK